MNGFTPIDHANRLTGALGELDGVDLLNFGSDDRDTTITIGGGLRYRFTDNVQLGLGAETPITDSDDSIFDYRLYADLVLSWSAGRQTAAFLKTAGSSYLVADLLIRLPRHVTQASYTAMQEIGRAHG